MSSFFTFAILCSFAGTLLANVGYIYEQAAAATRGTVKLKNLTAGIEYVKKYAKNVSTLHLFPSFAFSSFIRCYLIASICLSFRFPHFAF